MNDERLAQLERWAKSMDYVTDGDMVLELVDEVHRRGRMVNELLVGEPYFHHYGQCRWCERAGAHDDDCAWLRARQARDWGKDEEV